MKLGAYQGSIRRQTKETLELFYLLSHETMVADLARLPQYATKEKTLHMLSYPLLMAADIMIADCEAVIVGDDQEPHMHFYREVVRNQGGEEAQTIKSETPRIMSIKDPSRKMSKSLGDEHCIYINDDEETIRKKISKAPTTPEGIENLKVIGGLFCYSDYDSSKNADSKEKLVQAIISYQYKIY